MVDQTSGATKRQRLYGLLILAAIFLPMIAAYTMFKTGWGLPQTSTNHGQLLQPPQSLVTLNVDENDRLKALFDAEHKRWRMLIPVHYPCEKSCQDYLYLSRQVHIRLAEKAYRVERILLLLNDMPESERENLLKEHPETQIFYSDVGSLSSWLSAVGLDNAADDYFYLIDQEGYAMMAYNESNSGKDLLDDIKKLLKFTYDK